jgi:hypothetical protein
MLGICLFQQNGPQFISIWLHEAWLVASFLARNSIVHRDNDPFLNLGIVDSNFIETSWIVLFGEKHVTNHIGEFGSTSKGCHQPTITDSSLTEIGRFNAAFKELGRLSFELMQILCPHPIRFLFHVLPFFLFKISQCCGSNKGIILVGPTKAATKVTPTTANHASLQQDSGTWIDKSVDGSPHETNRSKNWTTEDYKKRDRHKKQRSRRR